MAETLNWPSNRGNWSDWRPSGNVHDLFMAQPMNAEAGQLIKPLALGQQVRAPLTCQGLWRTEDLGCGFDERPLWAVSNSPVALPQNNYANKSSNMQT